MTESPALRRDQLDVGRLAELIRNAPIGGYIGAAGADILAEHACVELALKENDYLLRQGETSASFFLVEAGRLARVREDAKKDKPVLVHTLQPGDLVGEQSFIDGTPHALSVVALTPSVVLQFKKSDIEPLIDEHPRLMFDFMRAVIKRVHHTANEISRQQMALSDYISSGGKGRT